MSDPSEPTAKSANVTSAQRALELKRNAAKAQTPNAGAGRKQSERAAAARSTSQSKPALRK